MSVYPWLNDGFLPGISFLNDKLIYNELRDTNHSAIKPNEPNVFLPYFNRQNNLAFQLP